jgi:hypothetical protein
MLRLSNPRPLSNFGRGCGRIVIGPFALIEDPTSTAPKISAFYTTQLVLGNETLIKYSPITSRDIDIVYIETDSKVSLNGSIVR